MTALVLHTAKVAWRGSSALTATQARTSGTTWTISPSLTLGEDDGGCPRTICAGLRITRSDGEEGACPDPARPGQT